MTVGPARHFIGGEFRDSVSGATFDVTHTLYRSGNADSRVLAHATPDFTSLHWLD